MIKEFRRKEHLMGSAFEFILVADESESEGLISECVTEVRRLESLLTEFSKESDTCRINAQGYHLSVEVSRETWGLIQRSKRLSQITQGAFDITSGIFRKLYNFKEHPFIWPTANQILNARNHVGSEKIELLSQNRIRLNDPDTAIGFGAIGKGFAADCVGQLMKNRGVAGGVINASGDLLVWGNRADGSHWKAGIADPSNAANILCWLPLQDQALATSGDAEQFTVKNNIRYSHLIDPKSGHPVTGISSVSVVCPSTELSDALATAITIMGKEAGMHFASQLDFCHCLMIDDEGDITTTPNLSWHPNVTLQNV